MTFDLIKKMQEEMTYDEMSRIMGEILSGNTSDQENADFMQSLATRGETDDELLGMLDKILEMSLKVEHKSAGAIDMCGTGGDMLQTFNISTTASFVVVAGGGTVAKHGNRSSSGTSGSADIFEYFGYDLNQEPVDVAGILERHGICFMFAQKFHPAMRHVAAARKSLKIRTVFNLLGPLSNPAKVKSQMIGVSLEQYLERLPAILGRRGAQKIMTVRSDDGMDELSTSSTNRVCILRDGKIETDTVDPTEMSLHKSSLEDIRVRDRMHAIRSFVDVLGNRADRAMIETTALNAAGGLVVSGIADSFERGVGIALDVINSRKALDLLEDFVADTGDISKLKEME